MPNRTRLIIAAVCVAYLAVRIWRLTDSCLWFDEIFSVHAAEQSWGSLFWFVAQDLIHPPLFYALLKLWTLVGGESLTWLRLFPVLFSGAALFPFLYLCKELKIGFPATLLALVFFTVNGALIKYAQEVRMYAPLLFLSLFSLWLFARFYFRGKNIWILTLVNVLLIYTHYFGWFVIAAEITMIFVFQRVKIRHVLIMAGIALASFAPWMIAIARAAGAGSDVNQNIGWMTRPGLKEVFRFAFDLIEPFYFQQSSGEPSTIILITLPLLIVIAAAKIIFLVNWKNAENRSALYLMSFFVLVPVVLAFAISWVAPVSIWGSRHLIIAFAPTSILMAVFVTSIGPSILRYAALGAIALLIAISFARALWSPTPEFVWCAWERLGDEMVVTSPPSIEPTRVFAFEDLIAYHLWFATRRNPNYQVALVSGVDGIRNDPSYFLPRGFDGVARSDIGEIGEDSVWIAFRKEGKLHEVSNDVLASTVGSPLLNFEQRGYRIEDARTVVVGPETCFLVKLKRTVLP